ncbi:DUF3570 domain-containing protein [Aurantivibrio plasticivorans]
MQLISFPGDVADTKTRNQTVKAKDIASMLAIATCSLLTATGSDNVSADDPSWQVDGAALMYSEKDRVDAAEPVLKISKRLKNDSLLTLKTVFDSLTGASPSGASPSNVPQTYTRPSGNGSYVVPAEETPLDDTFHDTRTQISVDYDAPIGELSRYNVGINVSSEFDYDSVGISAGWQRDFNRRNTTLMLGVSFANDTLSPKGGIPTPLASMQPAGDPAIRDGINDNKTVTDFILGVTQVINRHMLMQLNYSYGQSSGYLNDPYKIVSVVDSVTGSTLDNIYESRPEERTKHSIYWQTKYFTPWQDTVDVSFRFMTDDWGIDSTTLDAKYRWNLSGKWYLEPHVRLYSQTAADFYRHSITNITLPMEHLTADYRLAEFDATTYGAKLGFRLSDKLELSMRAELYESSGDGSPADAVGIQQQLDLYPDLEATILQFGFSYRW